MIPFRPFCQVLLLFLLGFTLSSCRSGEKALRRSAVAHTASLSRLSHDSVSASYATDARIALMEGRYREATVQLDSLIARAPSPEAYYHRAVCHINRRQHRAAMQDLTLVMADPACSELLYEQSQQLYRQMDQLEAKRRGRPKTIAGRVLLGTLQFCSYIFWEALWEKWLFPEPRTVYVEEDRGETTVRISSHSSKPSRSSSQRPSSRGGMFK